MQIVMTRCDVKNSGALIQSRANLCVGVGNSQQALRHDLYGFHPMSDAILAKNGGVNGALLRCLVANVAKDAQAVVGCWRLRVPRRLKQAVTKERIRSLFHDSD